MFRDFLFFSRYFIRDIKAKVTVPAPKELMETGETNTSNLRKSHFTLNALIEAHTGCYVNSEKGDTTQLEGGTRCSQGRFPRGGVVWAKS